MAIDTLRARVVGSVWQAVALSGVDLTALPREQQEKLVGTIADEILKTLDDILEDEPAVAPAPAETALTDLDAVMEEVELITCRPFMSIGESYLITTERIKVSRGIMGRGVENYELVRIQDIDIKQSAGERMLDVGDIVIRGHDASGSELILRNVRKPDQVYETLRKAWLAARKRHGLQFREQM